MEVLVFLGFIIYVIYSANKKTKAVESADDSVSLDDIFKEAMNNAEMNKALKRQAPADDGHNGGFKAYIKSVDENYSRDAAPSRTAKKHKKQEKAPSRAEMTRVTSHNSASHDCEETNYDKMDSLMGKTGSFNIAADNSYPQEEPTPDFKMGREDLLRSFIMSEVLQRYDINRIYSRIPSVKSDD